MADAAAATKSNPPKAGPDSMIRNEVRSTAVAAPAPQKKLLERFAERYGVEGEKVMATLKATAFRVPDGEVSNEQMMALLIVSEQYGLNPFTKEIYAFPDKYKGIVPVVSVDGWARIINEKPQLRSIEFRYSDNVIKPGDGLLPGLKHPSAEWIECIIQRDDRDKPLVVREYLCECYRAPITKDGKNGPYTIESAWQTHTNRFLRHKVLIQASRLAFGFAGIYDRDEADRIIDAEFREHPRAAVEDKTGTAGLKGALDKRGQLAPGGEAGKADLGSGGKADLGSASAGAPVVDADFAKATEGPTLAEQQQAGGKPTQQDNDL